MTAECAAYDSRASRADNIAEVDFRKLADPAQVEEAHDAAARLAKTMRTRLTRRDLARRRGYRLDLRRTIHSNISHGGVPIDLKMRRRKPKPLRLVVRSVAKPELLARAAGADDLS